MIDLAIIGGGPAGYVAAEKAGAKGLNTVLFEKKNLGGVCLNEGCIPTKTLLYSAKVYEYALHSDKYGVSVNDASFDFAKIMERKNRVVRRLVGGIKSKMKNCNVTVVTGEAMIEGRGEEGFEINCNQEKYVAKNLLVCTGSEAAVPPIPGLKDAGNVIVTNREILSLTEKPKELVIIGGGVIGMEFASFFNSLGTKVTVIEMLPKILGPLDSQISSMLQQNYAKRGIEFKLNCKVVAIEGNSVIYETPEGDKCSAVGDKILVSVGRRPNLQGFGLEQLGVEMERGIKVDNHMRTNVPNLYAAGDVVAGYPMLAHTASREGEIVVNNILGNDDYMRTDAIPSIVYTNPEVAGVGITEDQAKASGIEYQTISLPMAFAGRFMAENDGVDGVCKVIVGANREVLGVHMLGNPCSEILYGCCLAIEKKMTAEELQKIIFPHPTVSEIFKETLGALN